MNNRKKLFNDLYRVLKLHDKGDDSFTATIELNASHSVYEVHFPGNPITPGACIIQIITEILSDHLSKDLILCKAKNIKFINLINPSENSIIDLIFKITKTGEREVNVSVNVCSTDFSFVKITAAFREQCNER